MARFRTLVVEDNFGIQETYQLVARMRGHEMLIYSYVNETPLLRPHSCQCTEERRCADFLILDIYMPNFNGVEWLENAIKKGCKIPKIAVISGKSTRDQQKKVEQLGCTFFDKPFDIFELERWMANGEHDIDKNVVYEDWFRSWGYS